MAPYNRRLMEPAFTLARHLHAAAARTPSAPALLAPERAWSYADLLAEAARRARQAPAAGTPWAVAGPAPVLALAAYACSLAARPFWPRPADEALPPAPPALAPDIELLVSTSGSEGRAKTVALGHASLAAAATAAHARLPLRPGDLWLACLPLHHIGGLSILWRCAGAGAAVLLHAGFAAEAVRRDLDRFPVSHISLVPAMLARLLDLDPRPPAALRYALIGGAALAPALHERASAAGWPLCPTYGMSETAAQVATALPGEAWHAGLAGRPLPGVEVTIADDGRIRLRGPQLMTGYLEGGGIDADGWFTTGDLGRLDAEGRLTVLGRADDMLVSGGRNVHPLEVESRLAACPGIADVAVAGRADPLWGDVLVAAVVGAAPAADILAWSRVHLPAAIRPRQVLNLPQLPRNGMGKIDRPALRALVAAATP